MKFLSARQLAFVLNLKTVGEAKRMIAHANAKERGEVINYKEFDPEKHPNTLPIEVISRNLNLPNLQVCVDDIHNNYMKRPATRGWILNMPAELIQKKITEAGDVKKIQARIKLKIPSYLSDFLSKEDKDEIMGKWKEKYGEYKFIDF